MAPRTFITAPIPAGRYFVTGLWILFIFILPIRVFPQSKDQPARFNTNDTTQILQWIAEGQQLTKNHPDRALEELNKAYALSSAIHFNSGKALAATKMGLWYLGNNVNKSINLANEALTIFKEAQIGQLEELAEAHLLLADVYDEKGKRDSSAYFYYLLNREIENGKVDDPELAINFYTKLTIFWINLNFDLTENEVYYQTISSYLQKAKEASKKIKDSANAMSSVLFLEGAYYHGLKKYDSARYYYKSYIQQREKLHLLNPTRKISTLTNITDTYLKENNPAEALAYIAEVQRLGAIPEQSKFLVFYIAFNDLMKAKALYQLKQYKASIDLAEQTFSKLKTTGDHLRDEVVEAYQILAACYEIQNNFPQALKYKNIYIQLSDSLNRKEKIDIVHRQEIRYRMSEKDNELAQKQLTLAGTEARVHQRNLLIGVILLVLFFSIAFFELWRRKNVQKQKLQQFSIDNLQRKMEIERLHATLTGEEKERSRIARELHDGVGGLLSAAKMNLEMAGKSATGSAKTDLDESLRLMQEASSELRKTAHNMMPALLLEEGLSNAICRFCENLGSKSRTKFVCQTLGISRRLDPLFELPVYRTVQELVHNIVKHAKAENALVQVDFTDDYGLNITVEDDGIGLPENDGTNYKGIGLKSIADRVKALKGKLYMESAPGKGTSIYIEFEKTRNNHEQV